MNVDECVAAVARFGVTDRQARFLVTVIRHSGLCLPRQYAAFVGTKYGHKVTRFFERLTRRKLATECGCRHNRAALYHVRNHALYRAIGQPNSRYRRPVSAGSAVDRLIRLDAVISHPELHWLGTEDEKVAFFGLLAPSCLSEGLPHTGSPAGDSSHVRLFPDDLPMGVTSTGMVVFVLPVPLSDSEFRAVLQRHAALLQALPGWTVRLVFPRDGAGRTTDFETMARDELTRELTRDRTPDLVKEWFEDRPDWLRVQAPTHRSALVRQDLGEGEREAIELALEIAADALLVDDRDARHEAQKHGVAVLGTLRVLADASEHGFADLAVAFSRLRQTNFRASDQLLGQLLDHAARRREK